MGWQVWPEGDFPRWVEVSGELDREEAAIEGAAVLDVADPPDGEAVVWTADGFDDPVAVLVSHEIALETTAETVGWG